MLGLGQWTGGVTSVWGWSTPHHCFLFFFLRGLMDSGLIASLCPTQKRGSPVEEFSRADNLSQAECREPGNTKAPSPMIQYRLIGDTSASPSGQGKGRPVLAFVSLMPAAFLGLDSEAPSATLSLPVSGVSYFLAVPAPVGRHSKRPGSVHHPHRCASRSCSVARSSKRHHAGFGQVTQSVTSQACRLGICLLWLWVILTTATKVEGVELLKLVGFALGKSWEVQLERGPRLAFMSPQVSRRLWSEVGARTSLHECRTRRRGDRAQAAPFACHRAAKMSSVSRI